MATILKSRQELILAYAPPGRWAELGVEYGRFSQQMLARRDITELWLVDIWGPYPGADPRDPSVFTPAHGDESYHRILRMFAGESRVRIVRDLIENVAKGFPTQYFDFIYLDAAHDYQSVLTHLELFWPLVRCGGMIAGHDYYRTDNFPWIDVARAVDQFCAQRGLSIAIVTEEPCGSFAVYRR